MNRTKPVSFKPIFVELPTVAGPVGVGYQKRTVGYQKRTVGYQKHTGKPIPLSKVSLRLVGCRWALANREKARCFQTNQRLDGNMPKNQWEREGGLIVHTPMMQQYLHADFARLAGVLCSGPILEVIPDAVRSV